jgi:trehalose synthase
VLEQVELQKKQLSDYREIVGDETLDNIRSLAEPLKGARVLHINATAYGGGVAEILATLAPLMQDVGLHAEWRLIEGADEFFEVTKACHNGLQGMGLDLTPEMRDIWRRYNEANAKKLEGEYDYIVVHDPQPAGLLHYTKTDHSRHWIWRCHIDTSEPNPAFWDFFAPYIRLHHAGIFTMEQYVGPDVDFDPLVIMTPTIDPLKPKNQPIAVDKARALISRFGPDPDRPLMTQISRYDPWKDPIGVIDAYRIVKEEIPDLQLALVGAMASDDPEGWAYLEKTIRYAGNDYDISIPHNYFGVTGEEVRAFQAGSQVIVQKSLREGFGLTVTEGMWHGRPVVGGGVGGITLQIADGETGFLVDSVTACARAVHYLLTHPEEADEMGRAGRERVRERYLITRQLADYLRLFNDLEGTKAGRSDAGRAPEWHPTAPQPGDTRAQAQEGE